MADVCLRCLVLGTLPLNSSTEAFLLFLFYEMTTVEEVTVLVIENSQALRWSCLSFITNEAS